MWIEPDGGFEQGKLHWQISLHGTIAETVESKAGILNPNRYRRNDVECVQDICESEITLNPN